MSVRFGKPGNPVHEKASEFWPSLGFKYIDNILLLSIASHGSTSFSRFFGRTDWPRASCHKWAEVAKVKLPVSSLRHGW